MVPSARDHQATHMPHSKQCTPFAPPACLFGSCAWRVCSIFCENIPNSGERSTPLLLPLPLPLPPFLLRFHSKHMHRLHVSYILCCTNRETPGYACAMISISRRVHSTPKIYAALLGLARQHPLCLWHWGETTGLARTRTTLTTSVPRDDALACDVKWFHYGRREQINQNTCACVCFVAFGFGFVLLVALCISV